MGQRWAKVLGMAAAGLALLANDYAAEIGNGGLRVRGGVPVAMRSEKLFVSRKAIRVEYEFLNESAEPVETVVAFPWPGYRWDGISAGPPDGAMLAFSVAVDGAPVPHETEVRAWAGDRDITGALEAAGVDAATFGGIAGPDPDRPWLDPERMAGLEALGAVDRNGLPAWTNRVTHFWTQRFPPGRPVRVAHEYTPRAGGTSAGDLSMIAQPRPRLDPARKTVESDSDERDPGCPDAAFRRACGSRSFGLSWVRYILTTANTWSGPIRDFELIVEREPGERVTFCWDGPVEKVSPTRFRAARKDFRPDRELTVYFVPSPKP